MGLQSYQFLSLCFLGQEVKGVEICSLAGSMANVVWNIALKGGIQGLFQSQGWGRCVHEEQRYTLPFLLINKYSASGTLKANPVNIF